MTNQAVRTQKRCLKMSEKLPLFVNLHLIGVLTDIRHNILLNKLSSATSNSKYDIIQRRATKNVYVIS